MFLQSSRAIPSNVAASPLVFHQGLAGNQTPSCGDKVDSFRPPLPFCNADRLSAGSPLPPFQRVVAPPAESAAAAASQLYQQSVVPFGAEKLSSQEVESARQLALEVPQAQASREFPKLRLDEAQVLSIFKKSIEPRKIINTSTGTVLDLEGTRNVLNRILDTIQNEINIEKLTQGFVNLKKSAYPHLGFKVQFYIHEDKTVFVFIKLSKTKKNAPKKFSVALFIRFFPNGEIKIREKAKLSAKSESKIAELEDEEKMLLYLVGAKSCHFPFLAASFGYQGKNNENKFVLYTTLGDQGDLDAIARNKLLKLSREERMPYLASFTAQMIQALADLHRMAVVDGDFKLSNIFVKSLPDKVDAPPRFLIGDLAGAKKIFPGQRVLTPKNAQTIMYTPTRLAPEHFSLHRGHKTTIGCGIDIWSLGLEVYYLYTGKKTRFRSLLDLSYSIKKMRQKIKETALKPATQTSANGASASSSSANPNNRIGWLKARIQLLAHLFMQLDLIPCFYFAHLDYQWPEDYLERFNEQLADKTNLTLQRMDEHLENLNSGLYDSLDKIRVFLQSCDSIDNQEIDSALEGMAKKLETKIEKAWILMDLKGSPNTNIIEKIIGASLRNNPLRRFSAHGLSKYIPELEKIAARRS